MQMVRRISEDQNIFMNINEKREVAYLNLHIAHGSEFELKRVICECHNRGRKK